MFIHKKQEYLCAVKQILNCSRKVDCAVAFWGSGADILFGAKGPDLRVICNLQSGATNPDVIRALIAQSVSVQQHDSLHAKVIIGSKLALVGSANVSCNGLGLEAEEVAGWEEAAILTDHPREIASTSNWFESIWLQSRPVEEEDIRRALKRWNSRRQGRTSRQTRLSFDIASLSEAELLGREVYFVIYREPLTEAGEAALDAYGRKGAGGEAPKRLGAYEDWKLPTSGDLIEIYYGPRGALSCSGAWRPLEDITFVKDDRSAGLLTICIKKEELFDGLKLGSQECKRLCDTIRPYIGKIWGSEFSRGDDSKKIISAFDLKRLLNLVGQSRPC